MVQAGRPAGRERCGRLAGTHTRAAAAAAAGTTAAGVAGAQLTALTFRPSPVNLFKYPARLLVELLVTNTSCLPCRRAGRQARCSRAGQGVVQGGWQRNIHVAGGKLHCWLASSSARLVACRGLHCTQVHTSIRRRRTRLQLAAGGGLADRQAGGGGARPHHGAQHVERLGHAVNHAVAAPDHAVAVEDEAVHLVQDRLLVRRAGALGCSRREGPREGAGGRRRRRRRRAGGATSLPLCGPGAFHPPLGTPWHQI